MPLRVLVNLVDVQRLKKSAMINVQIFLLIRLTFYQAPEEILQDVSGGVLENALKITDVGLVQHHNFVGIIT